MFFDNILILSEKATVAQQAEQLICNQRVGGSIPFGGSMERFPSGQREQTVNLPALPSEVQILPSPPCELKSFVVFVEFVELGNTNNSINAINPMN